MKPRSVGFVKLSEPITGRWLWSPHLPERVQMKGRTFVISKRWAFPYVGVVAQYREDVDHDSAHLEVLSDGTYRIDHIDAANPERGHVLEHGMRDLNATRVGGVVVGLGVTVLAAAVAWLVSKLD